MKTQKQRIFSILVILTMAVILTCIFAACGENDNPPAVIEVTSVSLSQSNLSLDVGENATLTATILPSNATDKSVTWQSSDSSVAAVANGKVTAVSAGTCTITVKTANDKTDTCNVTVTDSTSGMIEVTSVSLNKSALTLEIGDSEALTATVLPNNATDKSVTWESSNTSVATVSDGKVMAVAAGTAIITAKSHNGKTATCTVTVNNPYADFVFRLVGNGYSLDAYTGASTEVAVPAAYNGKMVTIIGEKAFYDCSNITKIILPESIKEIGFEAFGYCTSLQSVEIPACTRLKNSVFAGCTSLKEISLPDGLINIGDNLFENCNALKKVTLLSGTVTRNTFAGCSMLEEIVLGENVSSVAQSAFKDCTSLKYLTMPRVEENTSFNEYFFNLKPQTYTINGTGYDNLGPAEVKIYNVGGNIFGIPVTGTHWYYSENSTTIDGVTYQYSGKPITVTAWENMYEATVGVSWRRPKTWTAEFYIPKDNSLKKLTITDQLISLYDEVFDGCGCEVDILQKFPVESVSVVGKTELFLDEFSLDNYLLRVKHTDGWINDIPLADYLSENDKAALSQHGTHSFQTLPYENKSCEFIINLKLHAFDDAVFDDKDFIYDGTVKQLEVTGIPEGAVVKYENNGQIQPSTYTVTATIEKEYYETKVLTATLRIDETSYAIKYVLNMENADNPNPSRYETGKTMTLQNAVSESFEFLGWYLEDSFKTKVSEISAELRGDRTLYAKWKSYFVADDNTITGLTDAGKLAASLTIPDTINDIKITRIGSSAFKNCSGLTSITIPNGVTNIGYSAFDGCSGLTSLTIGSGVTSIVDSAFSGCSGLTNVYWNAINCTTAGNNSYPIFSGCTNLKNVTIGENVQRIPYYAFSGCGGLTGVYITDLAKWCEIDFGNPSANPLDYAHKLYLNNELVTNLIIPDGITSIGNYAFYNGSGLTSITIPDSVTSIGYEAFRGCIGLTSVTIPDSVTSIGDSAFDGCTGLTSITIPDSVTSIGPAAFGGCSSLESITISFVGAKAGVTSSDTYHYPFGYIFGTSRYAGGTATTQLYYGSSTSSSTYDTYYIPTSLKQVTVTGGNILYGAFYNCSSLTSIVIPDSVTSIGEYAFYNCSSLTSIVIPDSVTSIGGSAFEGCSSLLYNEKDNLQYLGNEKNPYLYLAKAKSTDITSATIEDGCRSIGKYAFYNCSSLTSIVIPDSVTSIGEYAFYNCSSLTSIVIPDSVTSIGGSAFEGCSGLTSIAIPAGVTDIGGSAFSGCSGLTSVVIPDSVTSIGSYAFHNTAWYNDQSDGLIYAGKVAYYYKGTMPNNTSIMLKDGTLGIAGKAFYGRRELTSIVIPDSVTYIGNNAFDYCSGLTSITIGSGVTSIGNYAFTYCEVLTIIRFNGTKAQWNAIKKGAGWNYKVPNTCKIICTDGTI